MLPKCSVENAGCYRWTLSSVHEDCYYISALWLQVKARVMSGKFEFTWTAVALPDFFCCCYLTPPEVSSELKYNILHVRGAIAFFTSICDCPEWSQFSVRGQIFFWGCSMKSNVCIRVVCAKHHSFIVWMHLWEAACACGFCNAGCSIRSRCLVNWRAGCLVTAVSNACNFTWCE